ncbi:hypothetical protein VMT65_27660 [Nocardia sp. CDC153]|uniref:hypothetical protein n=1 Tax=Nocardia sp. CDC153 TaxID=3112167 RepID=UPI002DB8D99A|nr:hypothetical protein [Nocardia sp. CDC153]MEC3956843.1 hypothetical protein [Nocardia sp. CDC153]
MAIVWVVFYVVSAWVVWLACAGVVFIVALVIVSVRGRAGGTGSSPVADRTRTEAEDSGLAGLVVALAILVPPLAIPAALWLFARMS